MIKVGVVGGTGYTGVELLRLLASHPQVQLQAVTSRGEAGTRVSDLFPNLRGFIDLSFSEPDMAVLASCDLVFFATPNGIAMSMAVAALAAGKGGGGKPPKDPPAADPVNPVRNMKRMSWLEAPRSN